jgi:hypothetical protein
LERHQATLNDSLHAFEMDKSSPSKKDVEFSFTSLAATTNPSTIFGKTSSNSQ